MSTRRRRRHSPEQIVKKLRDGDAMLNEGKDLAAVLQSLEVSETTWNQYGGMKSEEAKQLSELEDENRRGSRPAVRLPFRSSLRHRLRQLLHSSRTALPNPLATQSRFSTEPDSL